MNSERIRVGLALGGGVARGMVHIGVLSVLEREGIPIDVVAGSSAGAMVGALYSAGLRLDQAYETAKRMTWWNIASPVWPSRGWVTFEKMERWLVGLVGDLDLADLPIPFAAVATDLELGEPVVLRRGKLARAVRASCSVPGLVVPVEWEGRLLGDGGVSDNLPVDVARSMGADYVIAVDAFVLSPLRRRWGPFGFGFAALEILVEHAGGGLKEADVLISPKLANVSYFRLSKSSDLIALGAAAAEEKLPQIRAALASVKSGNTEQIISN